MMLKKNVDFSKIDYDIYKYQEEMINRFKKWIGNFHEYHILQWSGNDCNKLQLNVSSIDMWKYYKIYLEQNEEKRKANTKLSDAVNQILNPNYFKAHRELEDAIATMGLFITLT